MKRFFLALVCIATVASCSSLPDYGIEYRIDEAYQVGGGVRIMYTMTNSGDEQIDDVVLEISLYNDAGTFFADITEPQTLDAGDTRTETTWIAISGTYTTAAIPGTGTPRNVFISGVWFNDDFF